MRTAPSVLALLLATALPAAAQEELRPLRATAGGGLLIAQPVGEFGDFIGTGWGIGGHFAYALDPQGIVSLRLDGGFIEYGREDTEVCISATIGCRIRVDLTTTNTIGYASLGPQLALPYGPVRPYVSGSIGLSYFSTQSSIGELNGPDRDLFNTTNFDDATFAWQVGGGLRIPVTSGRTPIAIDVGARYNTNGEAEYLREGDIIDRPDGSIVLRPQRSEANLVTFHIGASIGLRW